MADNDEGVKEQSGFSDSSGFGNNGADQAPQAQQAPVRAPTQPANVGAVGAVGEGSENDAKSSVETVKEYAQNVFGDVSAIFYGLIALLLVAVIVGYFLYYLIVDNVIYQQKILVEGTEVPIICNEMSEFKITQHLSNSNGKRRTYSFWIYINDINKYKGEQYRHIAHVGENHKTVVGSSPYIFLDNISNKIHVRLAPDGDSELATTKDNLTGYTLNDLTELNKLMLYTGNKRCGFTIEYVPIQRWVHIAFVLTDNNGGSVHIYVDGELIEIKEKKSDFEFNIAELKLDNKGNLFVGGNANDSTNGVTGFSGLISKFCMYNYDLNQNDIFKEYNNGPFSGLLTSLGLGAYGIRNPIYKLNNP